MRVKILRTTVASGYRCEAGKEYDLSEDDATLLIRMGKAEAAKAKRRVKAKAEKDE